jgi:formylglycine-generating enzyme required for sulfatase activity
MKTTTKKMMMKTMKTMLISLFALLLLAAQAQGADRQPLAVLVVGVDNWMFGDVIAHIVGEELKRSNPNLVPVTREKFVQNKLKALRRATDEINLCELRDWASAQGLLQVCLVEAKNIGSTSFSFANAQQAYSAQVINVGGAGRCVAAFEFRRANGGEMTAPELTKVAWEVVGRLQSSSSCRSSSYIKCHPFEPDMVFVAGGTFRMGCLIDRDKTNCADRTYPASVHVKVNDFWIGKYEITQAEWAAVMGDGRTYEGWVQDSLQKDRPRFYGKGDDYPAYYISYNDALEFVNKLNQLTGKTYRLPTEAEWEYAARGGSEPTKCPRATSDFDGCTYSGSDTLWHVAWELENADQTAHRVGTRKAYGDMYTSGGYTDGVTFSPVDGGGNELGIYDMSGNVFEWCADNLRDSLPSNNGNSEGSPYVWDKAYDCSSSCTTISSRRVTRGGSWDVLAAFFGKNAFRHGQPPGTRAKDIGFRVVLP